MGPLVCYYFSMVNTIILHGLHLFESTDAEKPWIGKADSKLVIGVVTPHVQGPTVVSCDPLYFCGISSDISFLFD